MKKLIDKLQHQWNRLMYKLMFHKYKEFPSAYASGAIAKCRKNKGKK